MFILEITALDRLGYNLFVLQRIYSTECKYCESIIKMLTEEGFRFSRMEKQLDIEKIKGI